MARIFNASPGGNEMADMEPARYFNLAIEQIDACEAWLRDTSEAAKPAAHRGVPAAARAYPGLAEGRARKLDVPRIRSTFDAWFERVKIPAQFRKGIRASGDALIGELEGLST